MIHTKRTTKTPSLWTGVLATLRALLHGRRCGARSRPYFAFTFVALALAVSATSAAAEVADTFAEFGHGAGQLDSPFGTAVDQSSGIVYVADDENQRIDEFDASGHFILAFGWGVLNGAAELQACTIVCEQGLRGSGTGQMAIPAAIAVDQASHDVYVNDAEDGQIQKYDPSGKFLSTFGGCRTGVICPIAVDSSGNVWVGRVNSIQEFSSSGAFLSQVSVPGVGEIGSLAVDSSGDFYVSSSSFSLEKLAGVRKFTPSGEPVYTVDEAGDPHTLGLDGSGHLFVGDGNNPSGEPSTYHFLEFDAATGAQTEKFGTREVIGRPEYNALAVGDTAGALYVASSAFGSSAQIFTLPAPGPLVQFGNTQATAIHQTTATLNATVDPEGRATTYHFQYITDQQFKQDGETFGAGTLATPESASIGEDFGEYPASTAITGLKFETTYRFRVSATNTNGANTGETGTFTTLPPLRIDSTSASDITATVATLNAQINPLGEATTYHFEYLTEAAYLENGASFSGSQSAISIPEPDAIVGSGEAGVEVSQHPQDLQPHTVYRYRVVGFDSVAPQGIVGPAMTFTTQGSGGPLVLPDGREWEMVSPTDKFGAALQGIGHASLVIQASAAGNAIAYLGTAPTEAEPAGNSNDTPVLSLRGSGGWGSEDLAIPHSEATGVTNDFSEHPYFSEDLSLAVVQPFQAFDPSLSGEASEQTAYMRTDYLHGDVNDRCVKSCYRPLVTGAPGFANVPSGTEFGVCEGANVCLGVKSNQCPPAFHCGPQFEAASPDLAHVVIRSQVALVPGAPSGQDSVEDSDLYEWSGGQLTYVGLGVLGGGSAQELKENVMARHAVSDDGSRIVFKGESEGLNGLLLRDTVKGETMQLGGANATFQTASADDSKIFFTNPRGSLEECEIIEEAGHLHCVLSDLTPGVSVFRPILGASENGSYVYFVTGGNELDVWHDGTTKLIATLSAEDSPDWGQAIEQPKALEEMTARVSPDGRWLAFMSDRSLTGYVNSDATSGKPDEEVYLYHAPVGAGDGTLACASCNPTGARPNGIEYTHLVGGPVNGFSGRWNDTQWLAANIPGWTTPLYQSRYLSDSGRLFFDSSDALVPQDTNGTEDVYEYEALGVGDCSESSPTFGRVSDGCVGLISSGTSPEESGFLDASESGGDVFFLTAAELSSRDIDTAIDVYDAHECSASVPCFPAPPQPPPACEGDACQSPVAAPENPTPGSLTFSGPGNPVSPASPVVVKSKAKSKPAKCRNGFLKKKGKCVRKSRAKKARKSAKGRK